MENSWVNGQTGYAFVLKSTNQSGGCTWCTTQDLIVRHNIIDRVCGGANLASSSSASGFRDGAGTRFRFENNLFDRVADPLFGGPPPVFQILSGTAAPLDDVQIVNNTVISMQQVSNLIGADVPKSAGFIFTDNIVSKGSYGIWRSAFGEGTVALNAAFSSPYLFTGNVIVGALSTKYPASNFFPASYSNVGFKDFANGNYALAPSSPFAGRGSGGTDPGADFAILATYTAGAISGVWPNGLPALPPGSVPDLVAPGAPTNLR
jgi:hypothetical protein